MSENKKSFLFYHKLIFCSNNKLPHVCLNLMTLHVNRLINTCFCLPGPLVIKVEEGSDVILPCSLKENIESKHFKWNKDGQEVFFYDAGVHSNDRVSHFPDKLKNGDASITITKTKVSDSGNYTCDFPRLQPSQTFHIQLVVREYFD